MSESKSPSNRHFGFGARSNRSSGIPMKSISSYLGGCHAATNNGNKCNSSLVYTADGKTLDCTEYCKENCKTWVPNIFKKENIPNAIIIEYNNEKFTIEINSIMHVILSSHDEHYNRSKQLFFSLISNGDIKKGNKKYTSEEASKMFCDFMTHKFKDKYENTLNIRAFVNDDCIFLNKKLLYSYIYNTIRPIMFSEGFDDEKLIQRECESMKKEIYRKIKKDKKFSINFINRTIYSMLALDIPDNFDDLNIDKFKFVSFANNIKIFKPSKYWKLDLRGTHKVELNIKF